MFNGMPARLLEQRISGEPADGIQGSDAYDLALSGPNKAAAHLNRGNFRARNGAVDLAIADYDKALHFNPRYIDAFLNRGLAFGRKRDFVRAIADFSQAIGLDTKNASAYYYRGCIYGMQGKYEIAIADFGESLRLDPGHKRALAARRLAERKLNAVLNRALTYR